MCIDRPLTALLQLHREGARDAWYKGKWGKETETQCRREQTVSDGETATGIQSDVERERIKRM